MARSILFLRRSAAALAAAVLIACMAGAPAGAKDGVIILRLEDDQPAPGAPQTAQPGAPPASVDTPPTDSAPATAVAPPKVGAASAVIMDASTGQVLFSKNAHQRRPNASTTKIMTAILLIENCDLNDTVTASKTASLTPFTSLNLRPGEKISVKDLLTGMMVRSANDAAVAAAEHIAGSIPKFAVIMNKKAKEIGCTDTHFVTPNGLYDKSHYSSAYDLCLMARYGFSYSIFNEVINTRKYFLNSRTVNKEDLAVFAKAKFLKHYPGADGVKSGYIKQAGQCYVASATRDGWRLVSTVLKSDNVTADTTAMMDWVFANFRPVTVAKAGAPCSSAPVRGGSSSAVSAVPEKDFHVIVPRSGGDVTTSFHFRSLAAPVVRGATVGTMTAFVDGRRACSVELKAADGVGVAFARRAMPWTLTAGVMAIVLVGSRYGTALAKGSRRRRDRFTAPVRSFNRYR